MRDVHLENLRLPASPGIIGREDYRCTAVLVPLVEREGELQLLFEVRAAHIRQGGEVCFPGGHFEEGVDSSFQDTALRETCEELGLSIGQIECLGKLDTLVSPRGLLVECYLGYLRIDTLDALNIDANEVASVFTVPVRWFCDHPPEVYRKRVESGFFTGEDGQPLLLPPVETLGLPSQYKERKSVWMPRVLVYRSTPLIWGITAAMVENVVRKVFTQQISAESGQRTRG